MQKPSPCRLFVIHARDAPYALILRRGPSDWYHLIRWQTRRDVFMHGAWFHGRIYEEKCDLSPDGCLFVYMCHGGAYRPGYTTGARTAVSKAPWLFAHALWPQGTTYGGGGRFLGNRRLALHGSTGGAHPDHPATGLTLVEASTEYHQSTGEVEGATWSGHDHRSHLIYCRDGKLFRGKKKRSGQDEEIADFNGLRPDPREAPDWARRPLG